LSYPFENDAWSNYFEDVPWQPDTKNVNQYVAGELARYLLDHPELDPDWRAHTGHLVDWIARRFGGDTAKEQGRQWGATAISEQAEYMFKMGSHTARFASILALWYEKTGDTAARDTAFRSFNWASYMCDRRGVVRVGPVETSLWFSDGYADYIRHFMAGLGSVPEWAPDAEDHLLRSTSIVPEVSYASGEVRYRAFDESGEEVLRLASTPTSVVAERTPLPRTAEGAGWTYDATRGVLRVRRAGARTVTIAGGSSAGGRERRGS
jgi:hypothetical protein